MHMRPPRIVSTAAVLIFSVMALFGLYFTFAMPGHHEVRCPFMPAATVVCENSLFAHLDHWHSAFAATVAFFFTLLAVAMAAAVVVFFKLPDKRYERFRIRPRDLNRALPLQELFARGILHPKIP